MVVHTIYKIYKDARYKTAWSTRFPTFSTTYLHPQLNLSSPVEGKVYTMAPNGVLFDPPNQAVAGVKSLKDISWVDDFDPYLKV